MLSGVYAGVKLFLEVQNAVKHMILAHLTPDGPGKNKVWQIFDPGAGGPCRGAAVNECSCSYENEQERERERIICI